MIENTNWGTLVDYYPSKRRRIKRFVYQEYERLGITEVPNIEAVEKLHNDAKNISVKMSDGRYLCYTE